MPRQSGESANKTSQEALVSKDTSPPGGAGEKTEASKTFAETSDKPVEIGGTVATQDAVALLKSDHREVEGLLEKYRAANSEKEKRDLVSKICRALVVHATLEEELFYPACYDKASDRAPLNEAQVEHDSVKILISELMTPRPDDEFQDAKVTVLAEYVRHHVSEEENPTGGLLVKAQEAGIDMNALGQALQARKVQLMENADFDLGLSRFRAFHLQEIQEVSEVQEVSKENDHMPRSNERERDEQGRFVSDDDGRGSSRSGGSRDDEDSRRGSANDRERDEQGRFMSDDDRGSSGRGRSSSRDDDDNRGGSRGGSGGGRGRDNEPERDDRGRFMSDDDRGSSGRGRSSSRDDDDNRGGSRGGSGGGRGRDNEPERDDRGRFMSDDDRGSSGRGRSSSRDDDDGRGWRGDSRGHAEAARRGWETRREEEDDRSRRR
jgi:hemerythrin superfamily protein